MVCWSRPLEPVVHLMVVPRSRNYDWFTWVFFLFRISRFNLCFYWFFCLILFLHFSEESLFFLFFIFICFPSDTWNQEYLNKKSLNKKLVFKAYKNLYFVLKYSYKKFKALFRLNDLRNRTFDECEYFKSKDNMYTVTEFEFALKWKEMKLK